MINTIVTNTKNGGCRTRLLTRKTSTSTTSSSCVLYLFVIGMLLSLGVVGGGIFLIQIRYSSTGAITVALGIISAAVCGLKLFHSRSKQKQIILPNPRTVSFEISQRDLYKPNIYNGRNRGGQAKSNDDIQPMLYSFREKITKGKSRCDDSNDSGSGGGDDMSLDSVEKSRNCFTPQWMNNNMDNDFEDGDSGGGSDESDHEGDVKQENEDVDLESISIDIEDEMEEYDRNRFDSVNEGNMNSGLFNEVSSDESQEESFSSYSSFASYEHEESQY